MQRYASERPGGPWSLKLRITNHAFACSIRGYTQSPQLRYEAKGQGELVSLNYIPNIGQEAPSYTPIPAGLNIITISLGTAPNLEFSTIDKRQVLNSILSRTFHYHFEVIHSCPMSTLYYSRGHVRDAGIISRQCTLH